MLRGDHWRVSFQLYVRPEREAELRQQLAGLKNSFRFAQRLREAGTFMGIQIQTNYTSNSSYSSNFVLFFFPVSQNEEQILGRRVPKGLRT